MKYSKEWLTKDEINKIFNNPTISRRNELIVSILYWCALRVSELSNLKVRDVDIEKGNIILWKSKKSDDPELVPVPAHVIKLISQWIRDNDLKQDDFLITSQKNGRLSRSQIYRIIKAKAKEVDIDKEITTHSFRRSRATHLLDAGLPIEKVSRLLRHNRLESTMTYLKISIQDLKKDIERIDGNALRVQQEVEFLG